MCIFNKLMRFTVLNTSIKTRKYIVSTFDYFYTWCIISLYKKHFIYELDIFYIVCIKVKTLIYITPDPHL